MSFLVFVLKNVILVAPDEMLSADLAAKYVLPKAKFDLSISNFCDTDLYLFSR